MGRWETFLIGLSQQPDEAGGSPIPEVRVRARSSPDNDGTGRHRQTARVRQVRRRGVRMQEPVVEPPEVERRLEPDGSGPVSGARRSMVLRRLRVGLGLACSEATTKSCGVVVARPPGKSWAPIPSNGQVVNVGIAIGEPAVPLCQAGRGKAHRQPVLRWWGGAVVVVRGWETRSHGEGRQRVRSGRAGMAGGRR